MAMQNIFGIPISLLPFLLILGGVIWAIVMFVKLQLENEGR